MVPAKDEKVQFDSKDSSVILCHVDTTVCWARVHCMSTLEYQSYGVMMGVKRINEWTNPMGHVQRTNPMGQEACYKKPDACIEDQSNGTVHVHVIIQVICTVSSEGV